MDLRSIFKKFLVLAPLLLFLSACGASQPDSTADAGVQDINPGERSVIQPPSAATRTPASNVGERQL